MNAATTASSHPCTLFIGSEPLLAAWNARAKSVDTGDSGRTHRPLTGPGDDRPRRPEVVVIEQAVAASGSGSALMARLHNERYERGIEIRLLPAERAADLMSSEPGDVHPQVWLVGARRAAAGPAAATRGPRPRSRRRTGDHRRRAGRRCSMSRRMVLQVRSTIVLAPAAACARGAAARAWLGEERRRWWRGRPSRSDQRLTYRAGIAFTRAIPNLVDDAPQS